MTVNVSIAGLPAKMEKMFVEHVFATSNVLPPDLQAVVTSGTWIDRFRVDKEGYLHVTMQKDTSTLDVIKLLRKHLINPVTGECDLGLVAAKSITDLREFTLPFADLNGWAVVMDQLIHMNCNVTVNTNNKESK